MRLPLTGGCQCGNIRYEITAAPRLVYTCHCTDCQKLTGSAFSIAFIADDETFRLTSGEPRSLERIAASGRTSRRWVCPDCGSWVCGAVAREGGRRVRGGTLDDTSWLRPTMHFWTRSKQPWLVLPEGARVFETQPG